MFTQLTHVCTPLSIVQGDCDAGDQCNGDGSCDEYKYLGNDEVCRLSAGPCDKPDYCTGTSHECTSADDKYGDKDADGNVAHPHECRPVCTDDNCPSDVSEVCPGGEDACPINTFLREEMDVMAGQHHLAATAVLTAT